ncbi:alanine racemase [Williamsia sp.]|uniref:alanine racemase n=1 Tax=Williamsia sp. TaxID=1872085 RepID=UPI0039C95147
MVEHSTRQPGPDNRILTATSALDTPFLAVDEQVLDANIARMSAFAAASGLRLRPHAKTHKSLILGQRQLDSGATGLTVATIAESETFAAQGFSDLFIAYPLWLTENKAARLRAVMARARVLLAVDSVAGAQQLASLLPGSSVLVEVDSGHHRTGVVPELAGEVGAAAVGAGLQVLGAFTFPGHSYRPGGGPGDAAGQESRALFVAGESLRSRQITPVICSGGSTPSAGATDSTVLTEIRPGVYVFNDAQQVELGVATMADVALTAVGTVVHSSDARAVVDVGSKILGADQPAWISGGGRLPDEPEARITALSEHHATIDFPGGSRHPAVGERVRIAPNHVCTAVNLADTLVVVGADDVVTHWPVDARGANT